LFKRDKAALSTKIEVRYVTIHPSTRNILYRYDGLDPRF